MGNSTKKTKYSRLQMCDAECNIYIIGESNVDKASILNKFLHVSDNVEADYTESCKYVTLNKNEFCFYF
jgi:hypothetical protein